MTDKIGNDGLCNFVRYAIETLKFAKEETNLPAALEFSLQIRYNR